VIDVNMLIKLRLKLCFTILIEDEIHDAGHSIVVEVYRS